MKWQPISEYLPLIPEWEEGPDVLFAWPLNHRPGWGFTYGHGTWWDRTFDPDSQPSYTEWGVRPTHFAFVVPPH
jgi:hypothetical protein